MYQKNNEENFINLLIGKITKKMSQIVVIHNIFLNFTHIFLNFTHIFQNFTHIFLNFTHIFQNFTHIFLNFTHIFLSSRSPCSLYANVHRCDADTTMSHSSVLSKCVYAKFVTSVGKKPGTHGCVVHVLRHSYASCEHILENLCLFGWDYQHVLHCLLQLHVVNQILSVFAQTHCVQLGCVFTFKFAFANCTPHFSVKNYALRVYINHALSYVLGKLIHYVSRMCRVRAAQHMHSLVVHTNLNMNHAHRVLDFVKTTGIIHLVKRPFFNGITCLPKDAHRVS